MEMCFHGNQHPSSIKHPFISLYSKYQFFMFICLPNMNSPVFPSLDDIYCSQIKGCSFKWIPKHLSNFIFWLDLIKTLFFKVLTYFIRSGGKFYEALKKNQLNQFILTGFMTNLSFAQK